jgi:transcriptional regulator with XRE-family HTH domain
MRNILKEIRKHNELTQAELANILQVGRGTIAQIEIGNNNITNELAKKISEKFNYSIDLILNYKGQSLEVIDVKNEGFANKVLQKQIEEDAGYLILNIDRLNMLKLVIKEFSNEKGLKGVTPSFDVFSSQNNLNELLKEFDTLYQSKELDYKHIDNLIKVIRNATECLLNDLYNNMSFHYKILEKYYKI